MAANNTEKVNKFAHLQNYATVTKLTERNELRQK